MENSQPHNTKPIIVVSIVWMIPITNSAPHIVGVIVEGTAVSCVNPVLMCLISGFDASVVMLTRNQQLRQIIVRENCFKTIKN